MCTKISRSKHIPMYINFLSKVLLVQGSGSQLSETATQYLAEIYFGDPNFLRNYLLYNMIMYLKTANRNKIRYQNVYYCTIDFNFYSIHSGIVDIISGGVRVSNN